MKKRGSRQWSNEGERRAAKREQGKEWEKQEDERERKKSMHLRASATLNILMAQYHRQCYRGGSVHTYAANRNPFSLSFFLFFLDCSSIPKLVRATMRRCPASNPYLHPFLRGHTPRVDKPRPRCYRTGEIVQEETELLGVSRRFSLLSKLKIRMKFNDIWNLQTRCIAKRTLNDNK